MIWWLYGGLKEYKLPPNIDQAGILRSRFDRIFKRARTGYATLDSLLRRLFRNKAQLLLALDRPEIPLNTNATEYDIRAYVMKRKTSGGTASETGRQARNVVLGLYKTCMKQGLSFYHFIGDRLVSPDAKSQPSQLSSDPHPRKASQVSPGNLPRLQNCFVGGRAAFFKAPLRSRPPTLSKPSAASAPLSRQSAAAAGARRSRSSSRATAHRRARRRGALRSR